jgi:hypothetical protein
MPDPMLLQPSMLHPITQSDMHKQPQAAQHRAKTKAPVPAPARPRYLRQHYPYWDRHSGRDHFLFAVNDRGVCNSERVDQHFHNIIKVLHFGPFSRQPDKDLLATGWTHPE